MLRVSEPRTDAPGTALVWFRDDLRVSDNPALRAAVDSGAEVIGLYVLDETEQASRKLGSASRWWLHHSLKALGASLEKRGARLVLREGDAEEQVLDAAVEVGADHLHVNRRYAQGEREQDERIAEEGEVHGVTTTTTAANLLFEPGDVKNADGEPFGVFSPFWRAAQRRGAPRAPVPAPSEIRGFAGDVESAALDDLRLLPSIDWSQGMHETWTPGEKGAHRRLDEFVHAKLTGYTEGRDHPAADGSSRLSPHLKFGELSPFQVWHRVQQAQHVAEGDREKFLAELGWREFDYGLLASTPRLEEQNVHRQFDAFPWAEPDPAKLRAWQTGRTGIPLVDAGMRELWHTGWMHNRVRMVTASFLIKNLRYDWRVGESWFWDCLVDADPAHNPAQWQWVAGSGADAAPFFRIFNPVTQASKFDEAGDYVHHWVPELRGLTGKALLEPWTAEPGAAPDYPAPIVDLKQSRQEALDAYERMRA